MKSMKKVLIIDDEEPIRLNLSDLLAEENFEVIDAPNGIQGLQLAFEQQPDLIICDVNMPDIDGFQVLEKIRENLATAKIPFIFLSAGDDTVYRQKALQLGANNYLSKPVNFEKLLSAIDAQLKKF